MIRAMLVLGLFTVLFVLVQSCQAPKTGLDHYGVKSLRKLTVREAPRPLPKTVFKTNDGKTLNFEDLQGKTILVNIWATWCAPCIKEMPSLDNLQSLRGGEDFQVVTISIDRTPADPAKFFNENGIENLEPYHDETFGISGELRLLGFPTTVIYNPKGREIAFFEGDAVWDSEEALALIDYLIQN